MGLRETTKIEKISKAPLALKTLLVYDSLPHCELIVPYFISSTNKFSNNHQFIPNSSELFAFLQNLDREEANSHLLSSYQPQDVGTYSHHCMDTYLFHPSHTNFQQSMHSLYCGKESLNYRPLSVFFLEAMGIPYHPYFVHNRHIFMEIENRPIFCFPAGILEGTSSPLFDQWTSEFVSFPLLFVAPVKELLSSFTGYFPIFGDNNIASYNGIFSISFVSSDVGRYGVIEEEGEVVDGIISGIGTEFGDIIIVRDHLFGLFDKWFEEIAIMFVGWGYLDRDGERRLSVGNNNMDFVTVEEEIGLFNTYFSVFVGLKSFDVSGVYGKGEFLIKDDSSSLSYEVEEDIEEYFGAESISEVVESGVRRGITEGEAAEESESGVETELVGEVSFGASDAEVDEEKGFEEGDRVVAMGTSGLIFVLDEVEDEREVDRVKNDFERVMVRDKVFDGQIDEGKLLRFSHIFPPICWCREDTGRWGYEQGGGGQENKHIQYVGNYLTGSIN